MSDLFCAFCETTAAVLVINGHSTCLACKDTAVHANNNGFLAATDYARARSQKEEPASGK